MECQDIRLVLALQRGSGAPLDPTERAALQQHLDACPDCAGQIRAEQDVDQALSRAMRAVAVPASARTRLLTRLQATAPRRWPTVAAAAAAALLLTLGGTAWFGQRLTPVTAEDAIVAINDRPLDPDGVENWYRERGIAMKTWRQWNFQHLWTYDVIEFKGRRVPKLIFFIDRDPAAIAQVIVLPTQLFDARDLHHAFEGQTPNHIEVHDEIRPEYVYLVGSNQTGLGPFLRQAD